MNHILIISFLALNLFSLFSCNQGKNKIPETEILTSEKEVREIEPIVFDNENMNQSNAYPLVEEKPLEETVVSPKVKSRREPKQVNPEPGEYYIRNGFIQYKPTSEEEMERESLLDDKNEVVHVDDEEKIIVDIWAPDNAVKGFSSWETHPLNKYLGKWFFLDYYMNRHQSQNYIDIFTDGDIYRFNFKYYDSMQTGIIDYTISDDVLLKREDRDFTGGYEILDKPFKSFNSMAFFLIDYEFPVGYFRLETEEEYVREIKDFNGTWLDDYALVDGTPIKKIDFSWGEGYSLLDASFEIDLGENLLLLPDKKRLLINSVCQENNDTINIEAFIEDDVNHEEKVNISIVFLDFNKAYIFIDRWKEWDDIRFSPEEKWVWYRLSEPKKN